MSHALYHTDGFVLSVKDSGESNRVLSIYTRELGLVKAAAQGLREARSKLRYSLSLFAHTRVSLVRGREFWRITGASELSPRIALSESWRSDLLARHYALVTRFVQGEERDDAFFEEILFLKDAVTQLDIAFSPELELLGVVRILYHLGYLAGDSDVEFVCGAPVSLEDLLVFIRQKRGALSVRVNNALSLSQL